MQQSVLDLVDGDLPLICDFFESRPHQQGTRDMVALNARFAVLTRFDSRQLLEFAVILLDLPAKSARLLCALCGITSKVVGHDPVRAARRHHNPEKFHLVIFGKAAHFNQLATLQCSLHSRSATWR